jgi:hypothetical protein
LRGPLDHRAEAVVLDARDLGAELRRERFRWRDLAKLTSLRRALRLIQRADPEAHGLHRKAALLEPRDELGGEHRQLVGPHARGDLHREDAALEGPWARAICDPRTDRGAPFADRDGEALLGEAIFARAIEELLERLGRIEARSSALFPTKRHPSRE